MKSNAAVNTLIFVGMVGIGALLFTQLPGMVNDIKAITSKESAVEQSKAIANLLSLSYATQNDARIHYDLPADIIYSVSVENGYVKVSTSEGSAVAKTLSDITYAERTVNTLTISNGRIV